MLTTHTLATLGTLYALFGKVWIAQPADDYYKSKKGSILYNTVFAPSSFQCSIGQYYIILPILPNSMHYRLGNLQIDNNDFLQSNRWCKDAERDQTMADIQQLFYRVKENIALFLVICQVTVMGQI